MGEYDFSDNLVALSRFRTPAEASLAQGRLASEGIVSSIDGESAATMLNHVGADLVGASLLVRQGDLRRAREILSDVAGEAHDEIDDEDDDYDADDYDADDYDADDWSGEDWSDEAEDYEHYSEAPAETPPLSRAWRAALIGGLLLPFLVLNVYSLWLIFRHRLWEPQPGQSTVNWRYYAAILMNVVGALFFWAIVRM